MFHSGIAFLGHDVENDDPNAAGATLTMPSTSGRVPTGELHTMYYMTLRQASMAHLCLCYEHYQVSYRLLFDKAATLQRPLSQRCTGNKVSITIRSNVSVQSPNQC